MNGNVSNTNFNISNKGKEIFVVGCFNGGKENKVIGITLGSINNSPIYACKQKIYDVLIYNRELTEEEIAYNYKVSRQLNGEDFSFDPIKQNLVASYRAYDKTNEDQDRDILKDLSGNGHDIQLYNFAFSE